MAIIFPMEKIFKDYIALLLVKYSDGFKIKVQGKSWFLVEKHKGETKFRLKPEIVIDKKKTKKKILDTK